ncbi:methyltransferase domain-containing protein [Muribacter muris]|uniref:tRNA1(Val) (adenine(37)-N6)-methyltransferase n=1 Tax=Muribacter muris TaxID=67855 RepID=A0A4Y9JQH8_9PAST|nr:methyltransferase [Muribacter muris]MBF0786117.1 methyltransferase [Muribacter muris]MBF0826277.1 methyltransferase [Muribacter muris]TFV07828.1 methyltransferase domain-containing protein [Muribacter muris]
MSGSQGFQFKRFFIAHDRCAMKVNTDGIVLGALADIDKAQRILDLGTGTGLIAIMLAQRTACTVQITAVELETAAAAQAYANAQNSPWYKRLHIVQGDVMTLDFAPCFDLIVSNPPYFEHSPASRDHQRDLARLAMTSHFDWLKKAKNWLAPAGKISLILPIDAAEKLIEPAQTLGLHCVEYWQIQTKINKPPKRAVVSFSFIYQWLIRKILVIYRQDNQYTDQFKRLTQDFYLNF